MTAHVPSRQTEITEAWSRWIKRRNPPSDFAGDEQAEADEMSELMMVVMRYAPFVEVAEWMHRLTSHLAEKMKYRIWPSAGEVREACEYVNATKTKGAAQPIQTGDRSTLGRDQLLLLDQVLTTARRWLDIPGLAHHGRSTLEYWGEKV